MGEHEEHVQRCGGVQPGAHPGTKMWVLTSVETMEGMFQGATKFNNGGKDTIQNWDTTALTNSKNMFNGAEAFNQPIPYAVRADGQGRARGAEGPHGLQRAGDRQVHEGQLQGAPRQHAEAALQVPQALRGEREAQEGQGLVQTRHPQGGPQAQEAQEEEGCQEEGRQEEAR